MNKFLLFTDARTGSSNLLNMIGRLYRNQQNISHTHIGEPFNMRGLRIHYPQFIEEIKGAWRQGWSRRADPEQTYVDSRGWLPNVRMPNECVTSILEKCYQHSCGIKHLYGHLAQANPEFKEPEGNQMSWTITPLSLGPPWQYSPPKAGQQNFVLLKWAVENGIKIIFLNRRGEFARALSFQLCRQTGVWGLKQTKEDVSTQRSRREMDNIKLKEVSLKKIVDEVETHRHASRVYSEFLAGQDVHYVFYEDFFSDTGRLHAVDNMYKICDFLGVPHTELEEDFVVNRCSPKHKQHVGKTLRNIPNINDVINLAKNEYGTDMSWILKK